MISIRRSGLASLAAVLTIAIGMASAPGAHAADACTTEKSRDDLTPANAQALYDCIEASLIEGYSRAADVPGVPDFRSWKLVTTAPLVSATHGSMFVNHWVNDAGADLYTRWEEMGGARFAVGTILAKESFRIDKKGVVRRGPLFLMEKVADGEAPDGWVYTRLFPNGKYQRTNGPGSDKMAFCHDCHAATIEEQDAAFFPPEEYRVSND